MPPACNYHFVEVLWCSMKVPTNKGVSPNHFGVERTLRGSQVNSQIEGWRSRRGSRFSSDRISSHTFNILSIVNFVKAVEASLLNG